MILKVTNIIIIAKKLYKKIVDEATGDVINVGTFPSDMGFVGASFKMVQPILGIYEKNKKQFKPIDYSNEVKFIVNYLFVPLYGYNNDAVGVLKFFNRKDGIPTFNEIKELEPYQTSIGLMIRHIQELKNTMSTSIAIKKILKKIETAEAIESEVLLGVII